MCGWNVKKSFLEKNRGEVNELISRPHCGRVNEGGYLQGNDIILGLKIQYNIKMHIIIYNYLCLLHIIIIIMLHIIIV